MFAILYNIYKQDLALDNLPELIYYGNQLNPLNHILLLSVYLVWFYIRVRGIHFYLREFCVSSFSGTTVV